VCEADLIPDLLTQAESKIVLLVIDGLGGIGMGPEGKTELEQASTPHLDRLCEVATVGLTDPVAPGITPGSGPSHLSLFGYDPIRYDIGRGVLEALGIDFPLTERDVAARGNFATLDSRGIVTDRRAGRLPTPENARICAKLGESINTIDGVEVIIRPGKEHRCVVVFRGDGLSGALADTDPQKDGLAPKPVAALEPAAEGTATVVAKYLERVQPVLAGEERANVLLLRGFAKYPDIPSMETRFGLRSAAIAGYPMYRGLARLVGMTVLETGDTIDDQLETLERHFADFDFFYVHVKKTDKAGEDGDFEGKVRAIEEVDERVPRLLKLEPDVFVVTSDHSTPAALRSHSWHPNPFLLYAKTCRGDRVSHFTEVGCARGSLGTFPALHAMPLMLAHALRLKKYGA
jgi:2,3-bisphosphoglycerate-independent phosphoglycerate mutase